MYDHIKTENKWQEYWENNKTYEAKNNNEKEKFYYLAEFPYPSGSGLHVGHVRSYTALDAMARRKRIMGYNVLFPIGWDAFGAPAEQYAIKNHIHPKDAVKENIKTFKGQIQKLGILFDWSREFSTTDPEYYKWTQWQFLKFYEHGMAYKAKKDINWCPNCKTGLSNEDSNGGVCERCGSKVVQKEKEQWMLKMSDYAEDLIEGLSDTEFQDKTKLAQINWIGKSLGAELDFFIKNTDEKLKVFTTRPDTLFGATFMVVAPEHSIIDKLSNQIDNISEILEYRKKAKEKTEFERTELSKEKTGVRLEGIKAVNPVNNKEIEIWISDYVMMGYGTGAIMAVPAHDERDYEFAQKFGIEIIEVIKEVTGEKREEESYKKSIVALVYNPKTDKYLTLNWGDLGGRLLIGGSINDNETIEECARREIIEETGYNDLKFIKLSPTINHHYFAYNKNKAYEIDATGVYFELLSETLENQNLDIEEKNNFKVEWISKKEIENEIKDELHKRVFEYNFKTSAYNEDGIMINSDFLNGCDNKNDSIDKMIKYLEEKGLGKPKVNYRLQDWIFSRQRFWGEPIPLIHCEECGWVPVPYEQLPVVLPDVAEYEPTDDGESPLEKIEEWVNTTCPKCRKSAKRETDTMPNWAGSSWYWLRYMDSHNKNEFASRDALNYWGMVDYYNGGMEHATRHLLYARFWNQFLYNIGLVPNKEPFKKRVSHGMILGENGLKMSKSQGNVVSPDDMVKSYGADALRTYEMFIGDYEKEASWSENGLKGCKKFLDRLYRIKDKVIKNDEYTKSLEIKINQTIKKVNYDFDNMKYNTIVSSLMILLNEFEKEEKITSKDYLTLLTLLNPIAPHITEELNSMFNEKSICESSWPNYNENKIQDEEVTVAVSINGKVRGTIKVQKDLSDEEVLKLAHTEDNVKKHLENKEIIKEIIVKNRIVNIVVK